MSEQGSQSDPFGPSLGLVTSARARAADEAAVRAGDRWSDLMARAARHLAEGVRVQIGGEVAGRRIVVAVGIGNNGGDGWAAAALLRDAGADVTVLAPRGVETRGSEEAMGFRTAWLTSDGHVVADGADAALGDADVIVDCLLGTGSQGPPRGEIGDAVRSISEARAEHGVPVVAADLPSGVDADTGAVADGAIIADLTITFGAVKRGLVMHPARDHVGRLVVGQLSTWHEPGAQLQDGDAFDLPHDATLAASTIILGEEGRGDDKWTRGRLLIIAGSADKAGAAILAATGAMEAGVGLLTVACVESARDRVASALPGAMTLVLPEYDGCVMGLSPQAAEAIARVDAVLIGPGLGPIREVREIIDAVRLRTDVPVILDADAINVFWDRVDHLGTQTGPLVLTPHVRELARIASDDPAGSAWERAVQASEAIARIRGTEIFAPRREDAPEIVVIAKGPGTVVTDGRHRWWDGVGGPELGVGGSGDLLAGMVAALVAASPDDLLTASRTAVFVHGVAGRRAREVVGRRPSVARIADEIGPAFRDVQRLLDAGISAQD